LRGYRVGMTKDGQNRPAMAGEKQICFTADGETIGKWVDGNFALVVLRAESSKGQLDADVGDRAIPTAQV